MNDLDRLDFRTFRITNVARSEEVFFPVDYWSLTDWGCALAGEVGEACNIAKKLRRGHRSNVQATPEDLRAALAKELADVVTYADLMAARAGIDLGKAVREKFAEVSARFNSTTVLPAKALP